MKFEPIDWKQAWSLEDYVISLFKSHQTDSEEFKTLLKIYGRPKLVAIWEKFSSNILQPQTFPAGPGRPASPRDN